MGVLERLLAVRPQEFLKMDSYFHAVLGSALFLFPSAVLWLGLAENQGDGVNWHLGRCVGAQMMAESVAWYLIAASPTSTCTPAQTTCFMKRTLSSSLWIVATVHAKAFYAKHFSSHALNLTLLCCACVLAASVWQLARTNLQLGLSLSVKHRLFSSLVLTDALASVLIGSTWIAFPDWILSRQISIYLNGTHLYLGRVMGATFLSTSVLSAQSLYWNDGQERRAWVWGRSLMCLGILMAQLWSQVAYGEWWTGRHWVGIGLFSIWSVICFWLSHQTKLGRFS